MNRYESRTCTFVVPSDWVAEPPFAFREPGEEGNRMGAQILERTLADMPSAAPYAREQKPILAELYEGFELLQEEPQRLEGPGEGYALTFRFLDEDENPSRGRMIYLTCGPLVCQLFLSGPEGDDRERDRLFESITKTFAFQGAESVAGAKAGGLTSEILRMPQAEAAKGWPGPWRKFPRCCVELPLPSGWEVTIDQRDDVVFRRGSAEIRLHRELGENTEADIWFADRMKRLKEQGDRLLGSEQGEIERGPYVAVLYEEKGAVRTWKTAAVVRGLDLFVGDQQPLVWTLRAPERGLSEVQPFLESLTMATRFLDPNEWETKVAEPWLNYVLKGSWEPQGAGAYSSLEGGTALIHLSREGGDSALEKIKPSILQSLGKEAARLKSPVESDVSSVWRGHQILHYSLDGIDPESGATLSVRAAWLSKPPSLYSILIRAGERLIAERLLRESINSFSSQ